MWVAATPNVRLQMPSHLPDPLPSSLESEGEGRSVISDSLQPHRLCTVHAVLQARILKRVAFPFSRGSSKPRDQTQVSRIAGGFFKAEPQGKPKNTGMGSLSLLQRIFPTQESNPGLLHCRRILYQQLPGKLPVPLVCWNFCFCHCMPLAGSPFLLLLPTHLPVTELCPQSPRGME